MKIIAKTEYRHINFHVVIGCAKKNVESLMAYNDYPHIDVRYNIDNMPEVMSKCDVAVTSRGRTGYELAVLGIPAITIAQNDRECLHNFLQERNGFTYLGMNPDDAVIEKALQRYINMSQEEREQQQSLMLAKDLRNGRKRVMNLIDNL